jgi:hypothetical protein
MTYRDITCEVVTFTAHNGEQGEAMVDGAAVLCQEGAVGGLARGQTAAAKRMDQRGYATAGNPHDSHGPTTRRSGNGGDRRVAVSEHGGE